MGKKKPTIKISKNHHHQEIKKPQLSNISSIKVLKPKVYITHSSNFKILVQQLTGNGSPVSSPAATPPTPITHNNHNPRFQEHTLGFTPFTTSDNGYKFPSSPEKEHTLGFTQFTASDNSGCKFYSSPEKEHTLDELSTDNSSEGSVPTSSSFGSFQEILFDDIPCMQEPFNLLYDECNNFGPWNFATEDLCSYDYQQGVSVFDYDICCSYDDYPIQY